MTASKVFDWRYLAALVRRAQAGARQRQHDNIHTSFMEPVQRLFNGIEPDSYIRPHRHWSDRRTELLVAVRGQMALVLFDEDGAVTDVHKLATEHYGPQSVAAVELSPSTWHTVVALMPGCVLLEVKAGPFDPNQAKDLASWAPPEGDPSAAMDYQYLLKRQIDRALNK
jgi:cupin fold WbuC family metalloprotein